MASKDPQNKKQAALVAIGFLLPMAVAHFARDVLGKGYERVANRPPPKNPADPEVPWKEAITWAVAAGVTGGLAKLISLRLLAPTALPVDGDGTLED
ncbi:MAG: DUF4235 domain-containing protein [Verrucomicrobiales bacterium]|nr:DUF4235 domain-containing protein [Verrucomicrobiales bacterium]